MSRKSKVLLATLGFILCVGGSLAFLWDGGTRIFNTNKTSHGVYPFTAKDDAASYDRYKVMDVTKTLNDSYAAGGAPEVAYIMWRMTRGRGLGGAEVRQALRLFLEHQDICVRYYAAEALYEAGSTEGRQTLISIMNSSSAIRSGEVDLRIRAAKCLANFRDHESLGDLLAYRRDGVGNPLLRGLFERFGNAMGPEGALLAKAEFLGLDVQGLNGPPVRVDAAKLRERALLLMNGDQSRDSDKDRAGWILAIEDGNPQGLARLVESAKKEIEGIRPRYGNRGEVLKMIGTIDSPESKAVLIKGLGERRTAEVCAANLLFCQSEGSEPVRRMLLDELKPGKDPDKYVLADEMKWILVSVFKDDSEVRAAAQAADARSGLSDWRHYVEMRGDWPVYNWSAESVYWYRRTKLESK